MQFADLVGFTAWSSMREPSQVFTLLETVYHEFDVIAKRRRVFKVETVGDWYVHYIYCSYLARPALFAFSHSIRLHLFALPYSTATLRSLVSLNHARITPQLWHDMLVTASTR